MDHVRGSSVNSSRWLIEMVNGEVDGWMVLRFQDCTLCNIDWIFTY